MRLAASVRGDDEEGGCGARRVERGAEQRVEWAVEGSGEDGVAKFIYSVKLLLVRKNILTVLQGVRGSAKSYTRVESLGF